MSHLSARIAIGAAHGSLGASAWRFAVLLRKVLMKMFEIDRKTRMKPTGPRLRCCHPYEQLQITP